MKSITDFEAIIRDQFAEAETQILPVFRKHNYGEILFNSFKFVHQAIQKKELQSIPHSVGTSLTTINDFLRSINDQHGRRILEELAAILFAAQVSKIRSMEGGEQCIQDSLEVMKTTCELKDYNYDDLCQKLGLDLILIIKPTKEIQSSTTPPKRVGYYQWNGDEDDFDEVCRVLKDRKCFDNIKNFKKLFSQSTYNNFQITVTEEGLELLVLVLSSFYKEKLISVKGAKGHLAPLMNCICDLDGQPIKKEGKRISEKFNRNNSLKSKLQKEVDKLLQINCAKSMRLLCDLDQGRKL